MKILVFLSAVEYDFPVWTNKQQLATRFAKHYKVLYFEPVISLLNIIRWKKWNRLKRLILSSTYTQNKLSVFSYRLLLPFSQKSSFINFINSYFYSRYIKKSILKSLKNQNNIEIILINYLPSNHYVLKYLKNKFSGIKIIYDCVDDYESFPGSVIKRVRSDENSTCEISNRISVSSSYLANKFTSFQDKLLINPNVADFNHFSKARLNNTKVHSYIKNMGISKSIDALALYVGTLNFKLDIELIRFLLLNNANIQFIFVGPDEIDLKKALFNKDKVPPNFSLFETIEISELPSLMKGVDFGIIPYIQAKHLNSVFPLKFFEYLSAGLRVITSPLPSLNAYKDTAIIANTKEEFSASLKKETELYKTKNSIWDKNIKLGIELASKHTWEKRMDKLISNL